MFLLIAILWLFSLMLSVGITCFIFFHMKKIAKRPWFIKVDGNYQPKISILIPTYNEADIIGLKLENLIRVGYPKDLMQIVVVDSNSKDSTIDIVNGFIKKHPDWNFRVLTEVERKGKSAALNVALKICEGEVVIVSDADCFWPSDILVKALPFLADPTVGAVSGPKILLNSDGTWVIKSEAEYLSLMNLVKLGESKIDSTLLFEGGFGAYKRSVLSSFDPYGTGSDDCGTVVKLIEDGYRALLVPEAYFYSAFPRSWKGKMAIKVRRANQIIRVLLVYLRLLLRGKIKGSKKVVMRGFLLYVFSPLMFFIFVVTTAILLLNFPYLFLLFLVFLVPRLRVYLLEVVQNYFLLLMSMIAIIFKKKFIVWSKPEDRVFLRENVLREFKLI